MRILLTNDDGYRAASINHLFTTLSEHNHEVVIVAPERNSSGAAQSIAVYDPISITQVAPNKYFVAGTPADSVRLGLQEIYFAHNIKPDLIISGVNIGENIGEDVLYSGTVGAAREGNIQGIPSIAFSAPVMSDDNVKTTTQIVLDLINKITNNQEALAKPFVWNVNIPDRPYNAIAGFEATELYRRARHLPFVKQITPRGNVIYWQGQAVLPDNAPLGTDVYVFLKQEKVSITPLEILPTNYVQLPIVAAITVED